MPGAQPPAGAIETRLQELLVSDTATSVPEDLLQQIDKLGADQLKAAAQAAVDAVKSALTTESPLPVEDRAVDEVCHDAEGRIDQGVCVEAEASGSLRILPDMEARTELEVARYRLASAVTENARKTLAAEVDRKKAAYAAALGARDSGVEGVDLSYRDVEELLAERGVDIETPTAVLSPVRLVSASKASSRQ